MGTTVLLLTSVMLGHRFNTSQALPNTVSASALNTPNMDSISDSNRYRNGNRYNEEILNLRFVSRLTRGEGILTGRIAALGGELS
jgi:hypothetical protein